MRDPKRGFLRVLFAAASLLALSACAGEYSLMTAPGVAVVPAGTDCSFEVSRGLPPADEYIEIGRLEAQFSPAADLEKLRSTVRDDVCAIGGQLVVGEWDGSHFMAAIVFRRRPVPLSAPSVAAPPGSGSSAAGRPSSVPSASVPSASAPPAAPPSPAPPSAAAP